ncbi:hypothetical protein JB92DRAFT_339224 [Gautieria morchelliformis]|nr:hypothetical protein JB92DRAFT_339224 [Gautieria morchelliformis]
MSPSSNLSSSLLSKTAFPVITRSNIPAVPTKPLLQGSGEIKVNTRMLHLDADQLTSIDDYYRASSHYHRLFSEGADSQIDAIGLLRDQGLDVRDLGDLGNGWSKRWSTFSGSGSKKYSRVLVQWWDRSFFV